MKGGDCPSWRGSLVVEFKTWLNKTRKSTYSETADSHMKQTTKHQNHDEKTAHGTNADSVTFCRLKIHFSSVYFSPRKIYCIRVARTSSPDRIRTGHVLMGLPLIYGSPPQPGESEPSPGRPFPTHHSVADKNIVFTTTSYILFAQAVRCWMLGFRSCATPLGTSRRGTLQLRICEQQQR